MPLLSRRPYALILALVAAFVTNIGLIFLYCQFYLRWHVGVAADYEAYWRAVRSPTPYAFSTAPFGNPPTTLILLEPLRLAPFWLGLVLWDAVTFAAFFLAGSRLYGRKAALLGAISPAVLTALIAGQISMLLGALVFAAFMSGPILCGILLGIALCAKPQVVFLAPLLFFFRREIRPLAAFCLTVGVIVAVATMVFGPSIWRDWIQGIHNLVYVARHRGAMFLTISPMTDSKWIGIVSIPAAVVGLYLCRNLPHTHRAAVVVAASLFAAPYSMAYDLAPLAVFAAAAIVRSSNWKSIAAALCYSAALGPLSVPCLWPSLREPRERKSAGAASQRLPSWRTWMVPTRSA